MGDSLVHIRIKATAVREQPEKHTVSFLGP
jgi:hypothetical protein